MLSHSLAFYDAFFVRCFVDIRGTDYPKPYFDTKVKVRWDDNRLYIGAIMNQTDFWGTLNDDESLGMIAVVFVEKTNKQKTWY